MDTADECETMSKLSERMESVVRPGAILGTLEEGGLFEAERFMRTQNEGAML